MRPIISYDDITSTPPVPPVPSQTQTQTHTTQPPPKKRKTGQNQRQNGRGGGGTSVPSGSSSHAVQHWDDPGNQGMQMMYEDTAPASTLAAEVGNAEEEEEEESRELTHEEIWDDSALIDAWNSAAAEYEAFHGPGKKWKAEPVKKSPLWYNIPPDLPPKSKAKNGGTHASSQNDAGGTAQDSTPLNFDTFVPTHDPSLAERTAVEGLFAADAIADPSTLNAGVEMAMVSQDEAFSRAMSAMYWSGYWTAVYHCRRNEGSSAVSQGNEVHEGEGEEEDEDEDMLPAQR